MAKKPGGIGSKANWPGEDVKELRSQIKAALARFADCSLLLADLNALDQITAGDLAALVRLAEQAEALYAQAKRARGGLDFVDLLVHTDQLLCARPELRKQLAAGLDQLLIDECQDTDRLQMELLWRLIAGGDAAPEPGRLFMVGDAKQSIYRFRGADAGLFREIAERLSPDSRLSLDRSFRTHAAGVAFVNHLFASLLPDYE
ncbi:MAG: UvrD-helicase domain-containing protein, partial [Planctomycetota bacterium]